MRGDVQASWRRTHLQGIDNLTYDCGAFHLPGSIEAFIRSGPRRRDNLPADCLLLFNYADTARSILIEGSHPSPELIARVIKRSSVGTEKIEISAREIARGSASKTIVDYSALAVLEKLRNRAGARAKRRCLLDEGSRRHCA